MYINALIPCRVFPGAFTNERLVTINDEKDSLFVDKYYIVSSNHRDYFLMIQARKEDIDTQQKEVSVVLPQETTETGTHLIKMPFDSVLLV